MVIYPQTLRDASNPRHHVRLAEDGKAKMEAHQGTFDDAELTAGVDYVVKDGGSSWLPYPQGPGTEHFRHIWIIQRRACMHAPAFIGAPIPHRRPAETERAGMITMAYFHRWTLRAADETQSIVPYAGNLRPQDATWELTLSMWLDGNVVSQESVRDVSNIFCVFRVHPRDQDEDVRSDEDVDDE